MRPGGTRPKKCLILAAERGSGRWRRGESKHLVPVLGVPLIERVIRAAAQAGVEDFYVVSGYLRDELCRSLDDLVKLCPISITHISNDDWQLGNGLSVLKAKDHLGGPFLLLTGDHLFDPDILHDLMRKRLGEGEIAMAVDFDISNSLNDMQDVCRVRVEKGKVRAIGKGLAAYNGVDTGIFHCSPAFLKVLEDNLERRADASLSGGVRCLAAEGRVNALDIGDRFSLGVHNPTDSARAERILIGQLRHKANDGPVARHFNRPISLRISRHLTRLPVTPDQISLAGFLLSLVAAGLLALGGYLALFAGGLLAQFASIMDGCDGEVARLKFYERDFGKWLDAVLDRYADAFLLFGLTWHVHSEGYQGIALLVGFASIIGSFMLSYTADKYDRLMDARIAKGRGLRIGRDVRIFIVLVGAVLNQPFAALLIIAVLMNGETMRRIIVCRK